MSHSYPPWGSCRSPCIYAWGASHKAYRDEAYRDEKAKESKQRVSDDPSKSSASHQEVGLNLGKYQEKSQAESSRGGESSRRPESWLEEQLQEIDKRLNSFENSIQQDEYIQSLPKNIKMQWAFDKIKKRLQESSKNQIINGENAAKGIALVENVKSTLLEGKELTSDQLDSFDQLVMSLGDLNNQIFTIKAAEEIENKYSQMKDENVTEGDILKK